MADLLRKQLQQWLNEESFWVLHAAGQEPLEITVTSSSGSFGLFIPYGYEPERDSLEVSATGNELTWHVATSTSRLHKSLYLEPSDPEASLRIQVQRNGEPAPQVVWLGTEATPVAKLPVELPPTFAALEPATAPPFSVNKNGLHVLRYQSTSGSLRSSQVAPLDAETIRQLRSLGYLK